MFIKIPSNGKSKLVRTRSGNKSLVFSHRFYMYMYVKTLNQSNKAALQALST